MSTRRYLNQTALSREERYGARPHSRMFGMVPDGRSVHDSAMTSGSAVLTSATGLFRSSDVGKPITVAGAGAAGVTLKTTIAGYTSATQVTLANPAVLPVTNKKAMWGKENRDAIDGMIQAIERDGNGCLIEGGLYFTSGSHVLTGNLALYGDCHRLDFGHTGQENGRYAGFLCASNKAFSIGPYPGVRLENLLFEGTGADVEAIEIYEQTGYTGQIGMWAGYVGTPLTLPTDDYGAGPGSGGLHLFNCQFAEFSGWGVYAYKLYGKSSVRRCRAFRCGRLPSGATESQIDRHGGMMFNSETVDIDIEGCHFIGTGPEFGSPTTDRCGTALKLGAKSTDAATMNRFYLGTSHVNVRGCLIEGQWHRGSADYFSIASLFDGVVYGDVREIIVGENQFVSKLNKTGWYRNIDLSGPGINMKCYAERMVFDGILSETAGPKTFKYWYPGVIVKNCQNIDVVPSGDKAAITRNSKLWDNRPLAFTDQPNDGVNLLPDYESTGGWTVTGAPTGTIQDRWKLKLYNSATATASATGLTPGAVYTFGFRAYVTASFAEMVTYRLEDGSAVEVLANQIGETAVDILTTEYFIMVNVVAPADGTLVVRFANASPNQVEFCAPWLVKGFASQFTHGGYEFAGNPQTGLVTGRALDAAGEWEHFDTVMSRKFGGFGASLTARKQSAVGIGVNIHHDGAEWITGHDTTDNGAAALLTNPVDGSTGIYAVPSTSTGAPQKLNDAALASALRVLIETNDRLVQLGTAGAEQNIVQRNRGAAASPTNVEYRYSRRLNGEDWALIAYDGTTSLFAIEVDYSASKVYVNGVDVTAILPGGGTVGNFLQKTGAGTTGWAQVDMGATTNVKTTGATLLRHAFLRADGTLEGKEVNLTDATHVELPISDGEVLSATGGVVSSYTLVGLTSNLDNGALATKISGIIGIDITTIATILDDLQTQIDNLTANKMGTGAVLTVTGTATGASSPYSVTGTASL